MSAALQGAGPADDGLIARLVEEVVRARAVERELTRLALSGHIGPVRAPGRGARAMVAAALALRPQDLIFGTARDWPAALARGVSVEALLLQCAARAGGPNLGRTLPGALDDRAHGVTLSASGPAVHLLHAVGFGTAARVRGDDRVALALFGIGAFSYGDAHAAFSAAPLQRAQTVFVVRGPLGDEPPLADAADAWGLRAITVDPDDGAALFAAAVEARARAVAGGGPTLIDARHDAGPARPIDARRLQWAARVSSEAERALDAEIRASLWAARRAVEAAGPPPIDSLHDHLVAPPAAPPTPAEEEDPA